MKSPLSALPPGHRPPVRPRPSAGAARPAIRGGTPSAGARRVPKPPSADPIRRPGTRDPPHPARRVVHRADAPQPRARPRASVRACRMRSVTVRDVKDRFANIHVGRDPVVELGDGCRTAQSLQRPEESATSGPPASAFPCCPPRFPPCPPPFGLRRSLLLRSPACTCRVWRRRQWRCWRTDRNQASASRLRNGCRSFQR